MGARQVPSAIEPQTTGSLLWPSVYRGAVAIKPTFGRLSCYGVLPTAGASDHPRIVVRSVADAALVLQAISRHDPRNPYSLEQDRKIGSAEVDLTQVGQEQIGFAQVTRLRLTPRR